jgi:hypothetical protein
MSKVLLCAVLALSSIAHADTADEDSKSELAATAMSVSGTLAGAGLTTLALTNGDYRAPLHDEIYELLGAGLVTLAIAPSLGRWYAHDTAKTGLVLRTLGIAGGALGYWMFATGIFFNPATAGAGIILGGGGIGMLITGTAIDLWGAHASVRRYNHAHSIDISVAPLVTPRASGLALVGTF